MTTKSESTGNGVEQHHGMEHFLNLNTILHSLVDFIRPDTFIAQDELETYNELIEKFNREAAGKQAKQRKSKPKLNITDIPSIRTTSAIYQFLGHYDKKSSSTKPKFNKLKAAISLTREELLQKLYDKMPHRKQQMENGTSDNKKRKRAEDKSKVETKKPRTKQPKEWSTKEMTKKDAESSDIKPPVVSNQLKFGRFDFDTENSIEKKSKKKGTKHKTMNKKTKLINTLKQVEAEETEINRLQQEDPEKGKELSDAKHWKTAMAKAKGEKVRDNVQLLRKSIKKQEKLRTKSAKQWQRKKAETDKRMKERQEKRASNIQKRKDQKKMKLKKKLIKKGRLIS